MKKRYRRYILIRRSQCVYVLDMYVRLSYSTYSTGWGPKLAWRWHEGGKAARRPADRSCAQLVHVFYLFIFIHFFNQKFDFILFYLVGGGG